MQYRFPLGPLTAMAIADAAGAGVEFQRATPLQTLRQQPSLYKPHTMYPYLPAGYYSDDTQRAIALLNAHQPGISKSKYTEQVLAELAECYQLDPRGYGSGMTTNYQKWAQMNPKQRAQTRNNFGSLFPQESKRDSAGAVMGVAVLAYLDEPDEMIRTLAEAQASATHKGRAILAAQVVVIAARILSVLEGPPRDLRSGLRNIFPKLHEYRHIKEPGNNAWDCTLAAIQCIEEATSLHDLLLRCLSLGGDTDTVATIAFGCAWNCKHLDNDLPPYLWHGLEDGPYGRSYLRKLELRLLNSNNLALRV